MTRQRVAYLLPLNSLDSAWVWVCAGCGRRYQSWSQSEIEGMVRFHQCPRELVDLRWLKVSRHRYRSK